MNNLAMVADNASALPCFALVQGGKSSVQYAAQANAGFNFDFITAAGALFGKFLIDKENAGVGLTRQDVAEWDTTPDIDPIQAILMQGLYRKVLGNPIPPYQAAALEAFFFAKPDFFVNDCTKLQRRKLLAFLNRYSPERGEKAPPEMLPPPSRLKDKDEDKGEGEEQDDDAFAYVPDYEPKQPPYGQTMIDTLTAYNPDTAAYSTVLHEIYESVVPGWVHVGHCKDVPLNACYVGKHCNTYVWVMKEDMESLTRLTIAILDIAIVNLGAQEGRTIQAKGFTAIAKPPYSVPPPAPPPLSPAGIPSPSK